MRRWLRNVGLIAVASMAFAILGYTFVLPNIWSPTAPRPMQGVTGNAETGAYLVRAAGCVACHTNIKAKSPLFAGGPPLKTPFGTFYGPNLTPDKQAGIGGWSLQEFADAMTAGEHSPPCG